MDFEITNQQQLSHLIANFNLDKTPKIVITDENEKFKRELTEDDKPPFDIDEYMGAYFPEDELIEIYTNGIQHVSNHLRLDYENLFSITVHHELSHWISHKAEIDGKFWNNYKSIDIEVAEFFAQQLTFVTIMDTELEPQFRELADNQSKVYQNFDYIGINSYKDIMALLQIVRKGKVKFKDFKNIEGYDTSFHAKDYGFFE